MMGQRLGDRLRTMGMLGLVAAFSIVLSACATPPAGGSPTPATPAASNGGAPSASPAASAVATPVTLPTPEVTQLKVGISNLEANGFIPKLAEVASLYDKYGLTDVEVLYFEGAQKLLQATIAGQIQAGSDSPENTFTSLTTDQPRQDVGVFANKFVDCIYTKGDIKTAENLKGKRVAISSFGGQSHAEVVVLLQSLGLTADDVNIVTIGGQGARVAALQGGSVDAIPAECSLEPELTGQGFSVLLRLPDISDVEYATSNLTMQKSFIDQNPNTVLAITAANLAAMQMLFEGDQETVTKAYMEWSQLDEDTAKASLEGFRSVAQRDLRWTQDGYANVLNIVASAAPELAGVDVTQASTTKFLDQLEELGLNDELGVPK